MTTDNDSSSWSDIECHGVKLQNKEWRNEVNDLEIHKGYLIVGKQDNAAVTDKT